MLDSVEHEIYPTNKLFISRMNFMLSSVQREKNNRIIGNLVILIKINFMLCWIENERRFITLDSDYRLFVRLNCRHSEPRKTGSCKPAQGTFTEPVWSALFTGRIIFASIQVWLLSKITVYGHHKCNGK